MSVWHKLNSINKNFWDIFFPPRCVSCNKSGNWLCDNCAKEIKLIKTSTCFKCGRLSDDYKVCKNCRQNINFNRCFVGCVWKEGVLRNVLHKFKYKRVRVLANDLGKILSDLIQPYSREDLIFVPVPLHYRRRWQRGFNHARELSNVIKENVFGEHIADLLIKKKITPTQVGLSRKERLQNLEGSFIVSSKYLEKVKNKTIVLVDDVVTTGATLNVCSKVLKNAGAKEVWGLVVAKS